MEQKILRAEARNPKLREARLLTTGNRKFFVLERPESGFLGQNFERRNRGRTAKKSLNWAANAPGRVREVIANFLIPGREASIIDLFGESLEDL